MTQLSDARWGRAVAYGILAEVVLIAVAIAASPLGQDAITGAALVGSFAAPMLMAIWLGRRLSSRFVAHGLLVGLVGIVLYVALTEAQRRWGPPVPPQPFAYTIAHGLKLVGGAFGGLLAQRRRHG